MLQKLFRSKSTAKDLDDKAAETLLEPDRWNLGPIDADRIRVLLCQEGSNSSKFALYDSHNPPSNETVSVRIPNDMSRSWNGSQLHTIASRANEIVGSLAEGRRSSDFRSYSVKTLPTVSSHDGISQQRKQYRKLDIIGDMIFGATPLAYKGTSTKIHYKRDKHPQIILTNLFTINPRELENQPMRRGSFSSVNSDMSFSSSASGPYMDGTTIFGPRLSHRPPISRPHSILDDSPELSSDDESSRYSSVSPSAEQLYGRSPKSRRSLNSKRSRRFSQTSIEDGTFNPTPLPNTRTFDVVESNTVRHPSRSIKYALAVVITLDNSETHPLLDLIFSHFAVIENKLHQLQVVAFKLLCNHFRRSSPRQMHLSGPNSIFAQPQRRSRGSLPVLSANTFQNDPILLDAVAKFKDSICSLYNTPRIQEPLWLNMSTFSHRRPEYANSLLRELTNLMDLYDNRAQNFLISTMITSVLTYHLSWVPTVRPPEESRSPHLGGYHHGYYDPLWAQLSDLYGHVGNQTRMARTIVVGQQTAVVRRIIYVLSYFIRCNEVYDNMEILATDTDSNSIFGKEFPMDDVNGEMEDHIVQQLMGSAESKSINIPRKRGEDTSYREDISEASSIDTTSPTKEDSQGYHRRISSNIPPIPVNFDNAAQTTAVASAIAAETRELRQEKETSYIYHMEPDITLAKDTGVPSAAADELFAKSYGRSLMVGYCNSYKSDFVLMGLPNNSFIDALESDMRDTLTQYSLTNDTSEAVCIVIDTNTSNDFDTGKDDWRSTQMSSLVHQMLTDVKRKFQGGVGAEECLGWFEDQLQLLYLRSTFLQEAVYQWRNGYNVLDEHRFLNDPKSLAAEIR
ncbi:folliculin-interacting protein middle domain-containing protein [Umbelopsis sp. PMI_123]|nr:folliculin-interacting protein middle domain-containing protein [Umbelopsis sp. PMI_123]